MEAWFTVLMRSALYRVYCTVQVLNQDLGQGPCTESLYIEPTPIFGVLTFYQHDTSTGSGLGWKSFFFFFSKFKGQVLPLIMATSSLIV